ncbi:Uncharacterized conserved protein, DUF58 family, contains vWF domain [Prosthecobacter debontii]|uniref:Uncharacterized conserved protein, DUF58 family, contains vWF domain n=1 Tax=Prosthecobacter debontii TaxID=48467 RepID=A0A1T4XGG7_9BACT|nr:DUF58 domain-containing protein [Prosthecobacter debontii]SKA88646.1 Uncharacterized conserved protein, DUF58 family, contains vWF domain [Prosthecobacter debontii]
MRPTLFTLRLLSAWTVLGLLASIWPQLQMAWMVCGGLLGILATADFFTLPHSRKLSLERTLPGRFALGVSSQVTLTLRHTLQRPLKVSVHDGLPDVATAEGLPWSGKLPPQQHTDLVYNAHFTKRGQHQFTPAHVLVESGLGFWQRQYRPGPVSETRCYPNYEPVVRFALLATANREEQMGIVKRKRTGATLDFHQLREYQDGDVLSRVDWKATSRRQSLVSRDYEEQKNQSVILVPDCGRRMRAQDGELTQFDHCLNAMLLIAFIALRQGDEVGVTGFGGAQRWLKPVKGAPAMPKLLNHLYDYETTTEPSDFIEAAERVMALQKRRALIILLTNLRTEDTSHLTKAVKLLQKRHLVLVATLREAELETRADKPIANLQDAAAYGALCHYNEQRNHLLHSLRANRIFTVDETAQNLPIALANQYLDLKASGRI